MVIGAGQSSVCHGSVIVSQNTPDPERSGVLPPPKSRLGVGAGDNSATWRRRQVKAKEDNVSRQSFEEIGLITGLAIENRVYCQP